MTQKILTISDQSKKPHSNHQFFVRELSNFVLLQFQQAKSTIFD